MTDYAALVERLTISTAELLKGAAALEACQAERNGVRAILASTDIVSLPNDYPLTRMAQDRMERIKDLTLQGLAEIGRAEKAEGFIALQDREIERLRSIAGRAEADRDSYFGQLVKLQTETGKAEAEIERLRQLAIDNDMRSTIKIYKAHFDALEEAARVADDYDAHEIAAVIRTLKEKKNSDEDDFFYDPRTGRVAGDKP